MKSGGLAVFATGLGGMPLFLSRAAAAARGPAPYGQRPVLVTIFQRGAMDGLMAVPPFEDPHLRALRPRLAMTAARSAGDERLIDLDGTFGLHPALGAFAPFFRDGRLAVVHGVGSPDPTRSHFDAQDYMETGTPGQKGTRSGWLNRAVGLLGHEAATPFRAVALTPALPRALYGEADALAITNLDDFGVNAQLPAAGQSLEALYEQTSQQLLRDTGRDSFEAARILETLRQGNDRPEHGAVYPETALGRSLGQIARLIKADVGLEVAFAESTGWDTHVQQGTTTGSFARQARDLAGSVAAFWTDLGSRRDAVTLLTMTEFGRTVAENGSGGTDHGRASCLFVLGNAVRGGRVYGRVPELDRDALEDGRDLPVTTDFRAVFAGVAARHLGIPDAAPLFPGWTGEPLSVLD